MELARKVHGVNETQKALEFYYNAIKEVLPQFIGDKIFLMSGGKSAKFNKAVKEVLNRDAYTMSVFSTGDYANVQHVSISCNYKSIWLEISCCYKLNTTGCFYEKDSVWLGDVENDGLHLKELSNNVPTFSKYNVQDIKTAKARMEILEQELSELKGQVSQFSGYYD